jgi:hypothetical protein
MPVAAMITTATPAREYRRRPDRLVAEEQLFHVPSALLPVQ